MKLKRLGGLLLALTLIVSAFSASAASLQAKDKLLVVTTFSILQDMTQEIAGERAEVISLVGMDEDSHAYQPKPSDSRKLAKADLVIENGLTFEGWMNRLVAASEYKGLRVTASTGIAINDMAKKHDDHDKHDHDSHNDHDHDSHDKHDHDDHDSHASHQHGKYDPHAWQSLVEAQQYVRNIRDGLVHVDPQGKAYYEARATAYIKRLQGLHQSMKLRFDRLPKAQRTVMTSHAAFGYLASTYGITFVSPQGISTTSEPSASEMAHLVKQIRKQQVAAIFIENIGDRRLVAQLQRETSTKLGGTLYSDALSKTSDSASSYYQMMQHNLETLLTALEPK
ncbi:MAG TPA: zinc ABC transporter substrate-binding protein [Marinospirillum sp.]|uniref:metal ABC transporter solute-binding protein, Zn/Mn family n=1 Tax=Marinospirillum sp. TaxID=2183934 RepID=UPI002B476972|nr:zinc ABC transporter substrate-binding protein [Marinospirillum sp.]HKM14564.1 zinc ABC transporter substrate-binding protein [Marinospirillum sp.]